MFWGVGGENSENRVGIYRIKIRNKCPIKHYVQCVDQCF